MKSVLKMIWWLCIVAVLPVASYSNVWTDTATGYTWTFRANGDTAEICAEGNSVAISPSPTGALAIPSTLVGRKVTCIGEGAFADCSGITNVVIPNSVTNIANNAFSGCSALTSVKIPDSVTSIGAAAFYGCSSLAAVHVTDIAAWCRISFGSHDANPLSYAHNLYLNGVKVDALTVPEGVEDIRT